MLGDAQSKQVRRGDLHSPASSTRSSPDAEVLDLLRNRLNNDITFVEHQPFADEIDSALEEQGSDDVVSFRLFASASATKEPQTVRLRSPSIELRDPGFVKPDRPRGYYFADALSPTSRAEYDAVALHGMDVLLRSKTAWPGSRMPWRVSYVSQAQDRTSSAIAIKATVPAEGSVRAKCKPGKKQRIALRVKREVAEAAKREQQKAKAEWEVADREKRTRRNREKKVKKREKEKAKKSAGKEGEG